MGRKFITFDEAAPSRRGVAFAPDSVEGIGRRNDRRGTYAKITMPA